MPRQARIVLPGQLYHVTQRGNFRQKVFFDDQDRALYLKYLEENAIKHGLHIYAFCLMGNHVHFIVKPNDEQSMANVFRVTHQKYSLYVNKRIDQFGHRWQSRFYSCLLLGDHISKAVRYVERNPVRAGIVNKPWQYAWSSARTHLGTTYQIITLSKISDYIQVSSWKKYLDQEEDEEDLNNIRQGTLQGKAFGPKEIVEEFEEKIGKGLGILSRGRPKAIKVTDTFISS